MRRIILLAGLLLALAAPITDAAAPTRSLPCGVWVCSYLYGYLQRDRVTIAVIGDQGDDTAPQRSVANLVNSWRPALVFTAGDNHYGSAGGEGVLRYDESAGGYYCPYLAGVPPGPRCPSGGEAAKNRFFPSLGNHDYSDAGLENYLAYFDLPGNERYYDVVHGPVHFFVLNSNTMEPDGATADGHQAEWLKSGLEASTAAWQIVIFHHPPYSSGPHGASEWMRWPFGEWGVDAVIAGHDHHYERIMAGGIPYFVNGLGGGARYATGEPVEGSAVRFNADWGAQRVTASPRELVFEFIPLSGEVVDRWILTKDP